MQLPVPWPGAPEASTGGSCGCGGRPGERDGQDAREQVRDEQQPLRVGVDQQGGLVGEKGSNVYSLAARGKG
eukprot:scaffold24193_cov90-Isochrysis_galbana.AAC.2